MLIALRCPQDASGSLAVPLALRAVLGQEPLAVSVGGHVRGVDSHVAAHVGKLDAQGRGDPGEAGVKERLVLAEFGGEAVEGVDARRGSEGFPQRGVVSDQRGRAAPPWDPIQAFGQTGAHARASTKPAPTRPAKVLKLS